MVTQPPGPLPHQRHTSAVSITDNDDTQTLYSHASAVDVDEIISCTSDSASLQCASLSKTTITTTTTTHKLLMRARAKQRQPPTPNTLILAADALIKGALAYSAEAHAKFARRISTKIWARLFSEQELRVMFALVRMAGAGLTHMPDEAHCNIPWLSAGIFPPSTSASSVRSSTDVTAVSYRRGFMPKLLPKEPEDVVKAVIFGDPYAKSNSTSASSTKSTKSRQRSDREPKTLGTLPDSNSGKLSSAPSTPPISTSSSSSNTDTSPPPSLTLPRSLPLPIAMPETSQVPLSFAMTLSVTVATLVRIGCTIRIRPSAHEDHSVSLRVRGGGRKCGGGRRFSFLVSFQGSSPCVIMFRRPRWFGVVAGGGKLGFKSVVAEVESVLTDFVDRVCGRRINNSRLVFAIR